MSTVEYDIETVSCMPLRRKTAVAVDQDMDYLRPLAAHFDPRLLRIGRHVAT